MDRDGETRFKVYNKDTTLLELTRGSSLPPPPLPPSTHTDTHKLEGTLRLGQNRLQMENKCSELEHHRIVAKLKGYESDTEE